MVDREYGQSGARQNRDSEAARFSPGLHSISPGVEVQIPSMTEEEAADKYVRGLKPAIRRDLEQLMAREGDKQLEELIRFADRTDSIVH